MSTQQNNRMAVSGKQSTRALGTGAYLALLACGALFGFLVVVWSSVRATPVAEPSRAATTAPEAGPAQRSTGGAEQRSAFGVQAVVGAPVTARPRPIATRPPLENPGGVNGARPARPIPGLRTR
jgi:hypothetical protein